MYSVHCNQCSTVQCSGCPGGVETTTVPLRYCCNYGATAPLQYCYNYGSLQGTAVLDSSISTAHRRQFRQNRRSRKINKKHHHGGKSLQLINQHVNKHNWQLTNTESKVWLVGQGRRGKGPNDWNMQQGVWPDTSKVVVLRFYDGQYHGCLRLHL